MTDDDSPRLDLSKDHRLVEAIARVGFVESAFSFVVRRADWSRQLGRGSRGKDSAARLVMGSFHGRGLESQACPDRRVHPLHQVVG